MEVQVRIFTVSGRLIKTIDADVISDGNRVSDINWDGLDDYGLINQLLDSVCY